MKQYSTKIGGKNNKNTGAYRDGYHVNSKYWQDYKWSLPSVLPKDLFEIGVGSLQGDSTLYKAKRDGAKIKIEQGYKHKAYVEQLWSQFKQWTFYEKPKDYVTKKGHRRGQVKSYYFRTFRHPSFSVFRDIFLDENNKKERKL